MPYLIKGLLEIYEDMIQALLMLNVFLAKDSKIEDLFTGAPSCSKTRLFFSDDLFCLGFESVDWYLQHDFARVADEADCSVILAHM